MRYTNGSLAFSGRKDTSVFLADGDKESLGVGTEKFRGWERKVEGIYIGWLG